jgi:hypothetical protein
MALFKNEYKSDFGEDAIKLKDQVSTERANQLKSAVLT